MANKKINELSTRTPSLSDLMLVGDPSSGYSYKCTITSLATIIETDIADGYVTLGTTQTITGAKTFSNNLTLTSVSNAGVDTDKFLVLNGSNIVNFRTGSEVLSDIGGQGALTLTTTGTSGAATLVGNTLNIPQYQGAITLTTTGTSGAATLVGNTLNIPNYAPDLSGYVPTSRTITINGTTQDLTANRTYNVGTVTSVAASAGTGISISGSPITTSGTITITNTAPDQIVALTAGTGISVSGTYPSFTITNSSPSSGGTVTSVALSAPTGFAVTGSPITSSGTLALAFSSGYSLPTTASQSNWNSAYDNMIVSAAVTGTTTKTLTLTQQDAGTITASWSDLNTDAVTSVFGRTGAVVAANGDYTTAQVTESGNLYYTDARARASLSAGTGISYSSTTGVISSTITQYTDALARAAISLTTTGSSGAATYSNTTGVLNIPTYTLAGLGGISLTSLSALAPLSYNNTTGAFSIALATASTDGYLRFQDWNFFADKIGGSGTTNYIPKFTSSSAIGNSLLREGTNSIGLGYTPSTWSYTGFQINGAALHGSPTETDAGLSANAYYNSGWKYYANNYASQYRQVNGEHEFNIAGIGTAGNSVSFSTAIKILTSGNVGIGTTNPAANLQVAAASSPTIAMNLTGSITSGTRGDLAWYNSSISTVASIRATAVTDNVGTQLEFYTRPAAGSLTQRLILDASGNLGLGVTPSAWASGSGIDIGSWAGLGAGNDGSVVTTANAYFDGTNWKYKISALKAARFQAFPDGQFTWSIGGSATAGANISFTQAMTLDASGRLAIGLTSPVARLHIENSASADPTSLSSVPTTNIFGMSTSPGGMLAAGIGATGGTYVWLQGRNVGGAGVSYPISLQPLGGNVGIGTTSPGNRLHVSGNTANSVAIQFNGGYTEQGGLGGDNSVIWIGSGGTSFTNNGLLVSGSSNYLYFNTNSTERMRITSGGNVGIGTSNPNAYSGFINLQVNNSTGNGLVQVTGSSSTIGSFYAGGGQGQIGTTSNHPFTLFTNDTERMRITSGGNVQIATGSIQTGDPSGGTKKPWKFGAATVTSVSHYGYAQVEIDGVAYYVGLVTAD